MPSVDTTEDLKISQRKGKRYVGPFLHIDYFSWMAKDLSEDDRLAWLFEKKNRPYLKYGGIGLLCVYLIFGYAAQLISNLVGFVYPAYCSIKALETSHKADDTRWLTYWVVFAVFTLMDFFSHFILSWMPFYWLAKVLFLVWCFLDVDWNGSDFIYSKIIRPFFMKHEKNIVSAMSRLEDSVKKLGVTTTEVIEDVKNDVKDKTHYL